MMWVESATSFLSMQRQCDQFTDSVIISDQTATA